MLSRELLQEGMEIADRSTTLGWAARRTSLRELIDKKLSPVKIRGPRLRKQLQKGPQSTELLQDS